MSRRPEGPPHGSCSANSLLRAFRRPADDETVSHLADLAESVWSDPHNTYEQGIAKGNDRGGRPPRFLYREEQTLPAEAGRAPLIDEYSLASRLSYFLWSSMPDDELLALAGKNELRKNLHAQVRRMLADAKSAAFTENFTGQWLEARDVVHVPIDVRRVVDREQRRQIRDLEGDGNHQTRIRPAAARVSSYFDYILEKRPRYYRVRRERLHLLERAACELLRHSGRAGR